nr:serine/threonine-protein kinase WNK4-like isoform X3 [Physcomitrium patens]|eukprot:XP_024392118.1 serine/threonine-protein kinase WNK4-like isoform X3 [Physcomitrella patens]
MPLSPPTLTPLCSAFVLLRSFAFPPPSSSSSRDSRHSLPSPCLQSNASLPSPPPRHLHWNPPLPSPSVSLPACLPPSLPGLFRQELQRRYHLQNCEPCTVHCCLHWYALCQEHREMQGRLSDNVVMPMTVINPPP